MRDARKAAPAIIALVGNPNTGKTALFNALTGFRRHVANYAGVTVDVGRGPIRGARRPLDLLDLPGTYSLAAASPDEMILCNALCGRLPGQPRPSAIVAIVDAANPTRNFYLVSQLLEVGLPVVVALNMMDLAEARGIEYDLPRLEGRLSVPVVPVVATRPATVEPLVRAVEECLDRSPGTARVELPPLLVTEAEQLRGAVEPSLTTGEALRVLIDREGLAERQFAARGGDGALVVAGRERLSKAGIEPAAAEVQARYGWTNRVLSGVVTRRLVPDDTWTSRLDRIVTHRLAGLVLLLAVLYALFYAMYTLADPVMSRIEGVFTWIGTHVAAALGEGVIASVVVDGLISGVGSVVIFLPQILILFAFIAILEDCGYLSRAAFMVDRLMRPFGLSGRAFIPLLSSFACAVPAILGTRAIADRRERLITILIAPFMSCSARLPVYVLLIGALVPPLSWWGGWVRLDALTMLAMYLVGVVVAIPVAMLLNRTVLAGPPAVFMLELPSYKLPRLRAIHQRVYLAGRGFLYRAGSVILLVNMVVWALGYFPRSPATRSAIEQRASAANWSAAEFDSRLAGAYLEDSYLGRVGKAIEPAIRPLSWDWRVGVGVVASFPAREVIIATLGTVLNLGAGAADEPETLKSAIRGMRWPESEKPVFTLPVALSVMVFVALCAQCGATLAVIGKETGSWWWAAASFTGMTTLAYLAAWGTVHAARALGW